jgi:hypothetical protein
MVSSVNTLDCWRFKEKECILLLCVACALVIGLKHVGQIGVLLWFSVVKPTHQTQSFLHLDD